MTTTPKFDIVTSDLAVDALVEEITADIVLSSDTEVEDAAFAHGDTPEAAYADLAADAGYLAAVAAAHPPMALRA